MSESQSTSAAAKKRKQFWAKVVTIAILLIVAVLKPQVEAWLEGRTNSGNSTASVDSNRGTKNSGDAFGPDSGDLGTLDLSDGGSSSAIVVDDFDLDSFVSVKDDPPPQKTGGGQTGSSSAKSSNPGSGSSSSDKPGSTTKASGNDARSNPNKTSGSKPASTKPDSTKPTAPPPGKLTLVNRSRQEFKSTAGLMYVRGSQDGHRLKHVLKHGEDDLSKPVHGVFDGDGDKDKILAWIDIAYEKGKKGGKGTRKEDQGGRTVYTVRMDSRIGFVGGQKGQRGRERPCQYLRLVLQNGNEVVTAYPQDSM